MARFVNGFSRIIRVPQGGYTVGPAWRTTLSIPLRSSEGGSTPSSSKLMWSSGQPVGARRVRPPHSGQTLAGPDDKATVGSPVVSAAPQLDSTPNAALQAYFEWAEAIRTGPFDHRHTALVSKPDALWIYTPWFAGGCPVPDALVPPSGHLRAGSLIMACLYCIERVAIFSHPMPLRYGARWEQRIQQDFARALFDTTVTPPLAEHVADFQRAVATAQAAMPPGTRNRQTSETEMRLAFGAMHYFLLPDEKAYLGSLAEGERVQAAFELLNYKVQLWVSVLHTELPVYEAARATIAPIDARRELGSAAEHTAELVDSWLSALPPIESDWQLPTGEEADHYLRTSYMSIIAGLPLALNRLTAAVFSQVGTDAYLNAFRRRFNEGLRGRQPIESNFIYRQLRRWVAATLVREGLYHLIYTARQLPHEAAMTLPTSGLEIWDSTFSDADLDALLAQLATDPLGARMTVDACFGDPYAAGSPTEEPPQ
ncbi:MAG: hypothetical protein HY696_02220 [Deltaproteobacteria bacterium]|nr:hypothetical protein [Deltaproteobacteria bacterium]